MNNALSEHSEQAALFRWAAWAENSPRIPRITLDGETISALALLHAVPNGGYRTKKTAADMKAEGVRPGVPDICLPWPSGDRHGLYIELKRTRGGRLSPAQCRWLRTLTALGYQARVCRGWEEAREAILEYLEVNK